MTKPRKRSKPSSIFPPSLVFLLLTIVSVVIELWRELPIAPGNLIRIVVGPVLILLGSALWLLAWNEFRRHGEVFGHQYATETVVTSGPYRISRHPAYLAYAVIMAGIGLFIDCGMDHAAAAGGGADRQHLGRPGGIVPDGEARKHLSPLQVGSAALDLTAPPHPRMARLLGACRRIPSGISVMLSMMHGCEVAVEHVAGSEFTGTSMVSTSQSLASDLASCLQVPCILRPGQRWASVIL